ncbi:3-hydroxybutyrate dehydrogenase [Sporichthya brevicatena]|uniref:3-hydroxybutyrate dehydrogenase n=1 Tax=Sporichthya brevicatena TaxID=171442 RepID=A0ABP3S2M7_9ACTN
MADPVAGTQLAGHVAVVTGGSRGIGLGIARAFVAQGATVVICGRDAERGKRAQEELGAAEFVAVDVSSQHAAEDLIDRTVAAYGSLEILVNNAGGPNVGARVVETTDESWRNAFAVNVDAPFWTMRRALPHMIAREHGRILNVSSILGKTGSPGQAPYVASKHALNGLTKSVAHEVGASGVTVNALCPGLVLTDFVRRYEDDAAAAMGLTPEQMLAMYLAMSATRRPVTVEEIGALAVYLASPAGASVTGAQISIDGGMAPY